jgi:hypothetical protein
VFRTSIPPASFLAMCVRPGSVIELAYSFSALCGVTTVTHIW